MTQLPLQKLVTGLHILGKLYSDEISLLSDPRLVSGKIADFISQVDLHQVGEAEHVFPGNGFTLVALLAESHLCIHTWPESRYLTVDVFVCNMSRNNSSAARLLFDLVTELFNPTEIIKKEVIR